MKIAFLIILLCFHIAIIISITLKSNFTKERGLYGYISYIIIHVYEYLNIYVYLYIFIHIHVRKIVYRNVYNFICYLI